MRIYLDTCCLCRPFDDQSQFRIHAEAEAINRILDRVKKGDLFWVTSGVVEFEIGRTQDEALKQDVLTILQFSNEKYRMTHETHHFALKLKEVGLPDLDSLHISCAESADCSVFLTTDDRLIRKSRSAEKLLSISIKNPLYWWLEVFEQ